MTFLARMLDQLLSGWRGTGAQPAYAALAERIRLLVLDGRIPLGTRLPAERELAETLSVSRTTVSAAYADLRDGGYLESLRGSGSVARLPGRAHLGTDHAPNDPAASGLLDFSKASLPAMPDVAAAATKAATLLPAYLGDSGFDPVGLPVLRQAIADRYTSRGLPTDPDQIMVTVGAQSAIALISRTLMARGDRALVEAPSYPHAYEALRIGGARLVPVSVTTDDGWDVAGLEQAIRRTSPSLGYLMPDFHNPTGRSMSAEVREATIDLAAQHGTVLVADETMAELAIDGEPSLPFAAHPLADESVILIGSVGKTVWGGLRIGWIRSNPATIQKLVRSRSAGDLGTPLLEQLIVSELLADFEPVLQTRRLQLRAGRDHLFARLAERLPEWDVPAVSGGITAWVGLGEPVSSRLTIAARAQGLVIAAGPRFGVDGAFERFLRVPFSYSIDEIDRGVDALAAAWASLGHAAWAPQEEFAEVV